MGLTSKIKRAYKICTTISQSSPRSSYSNNIYNQNCNNLDDIKELFVGNKLKNPNY